MGITCDTCSSSSAKVRDTPGTRRTTKRPGKKVPTATHDDSDSEYDTDADDGENGAVPQLPDTQSQLAQVAKFKELVCKSSDEDKAIALADKYHAIDLRSVSFPKGFDCLRMATRNEMPKLVLFLLEEGHSVKSICKIANVLYVVGILRYAHCKISIDKQYRTIIHSNDARIEGFVHVVSYTAQHNEWYHEREGIAFCCEIWESCHLRIAVAIWR